ncbi:MAG TPA: NAD(P)-dependent oxidoreductase [Nitrospirae bacterium]|nr:NAD(P)-dependent oxidoreductase [Nitrospirota bacterium]
MKALVTGATGFIGSHLVEKLLGQGYEVACITRNASDAGWIKNLDINLIEGDCSDKALLNRCVSGYDYIFHLSGLTKTSSKEEFYAVNETGAGNIIEAVAKKNPNIRRFVYLSSLSAFGPRVDDPVPSEDHEPHPVSDYGSSKLGGEHAVLRFSNDIPVSILRASAVYGPRDKEFLLLFKMIKRGLLPYWGNGSTSMVYIDDLINAIILAVKDENAVGKIYFISDGVIYSNSEITAEMASAIHATPLKIRISKKILPTIGFFGNKISKITGISSMINSDKIKELMYDDWVCDIAKAKRDLCFEPKISLKEGIKWTADWYRIHKWL